MLAELHAAPRSKGGPRFPLPATAGGAGASRGASQSSQGSAASASGASSGKRKDRITTPQEKIFLLVRRDGWMVKFVTNHCIIISTEYIDLYEDLTCSHAVG